MSASHFPVPAELLLDRLAAECQPPPASADAALRMARFERGARQALPQPLRAFHRRFDSASIGELRLDPLAHWAPVPVALFGDEWRGAEPAGWYAIGKLGAAVLGIDLSPGPRGEHLVFTCPDEHVSRRPIVARCFVELLARAVEHARTRTANTNVWKTLGTVDVPFLPPPSWLQRTYSVWGSYPEEGPEGCRWARCARHRIGPSEYCRKHHFEIIHGLAYPFVE
jgi:hypothetical protein